mmetsp:Transcript_77256/g.202697  ORF Transcript_77256/g.202697 Transcript_77256/m.202697 type:complete len:236 (+) Transcript_77256:52-759(+)
MRDPLAISNLVRQMHSARNQQWAQLAARTPRTFVPMCPSAVEARDLEGQRASRALWQGGQGHDLEDGLLRRHFAAQDAGHGGQHGHQHPVLVRELHDELGSEDPFSSAPAAAQNGLDGLSLSQTYADLAVAREVSEAGQQDVPHARESGHGLRPGPHLHGEPPDLRGALADERGHGVDAEAEALADAGRDGEDVLQRARHLHAGDVIGDGHAELGRGQDPLHQGRRLEVLGGRHN